ncbi:hypothetical protein QE152_g6183 [Popillia japonica]|uniref:Uncharacterized protein n=1 Tax=Popillia japonica TaxID=7064 RepID=A0AAW1MK17_POPJA
MDLEEEFTAVEKQYFADCGEDYEDQSGGAGVSEIEDDVVPDSSFEMSLQDTDENKAVLEFLKNACGTQKCNKLIPKDMIVESRINFMDLEKDQQDIVILSKIESGRVSEKLNDAY